MGSYSRLKKAILESQQLKLIFVYSSELAKEVLEKNHKKFGNPLLTDGKDWLIIYSHALVTDILTRLDNAVYKYRNNIVSRDFWFRATDNKNEPEILDNFRSKNFADNRMERGMSVSEHPKYQSYQGYKYIYVVTGDVIGRGSDGEPLLDNVKALSKPAKELSKIWKNKYEKSLQTDIPYFTNINRETYGGLGDDGSVQDFLKKYDLKNFELKLII